MFYPFILMDSWTVKRCPIPIADAATQPQCLARRITLGQGSGAGRGSTDGTLQRTNEVGAVFRNVVHGG